MSRTLQNTRCPLQVECERKCAFQNHELDCDYYNANAREELVIADQEERRREEERQWYERELEDSIAEDNGRCFCWSCSATDCTCVGTLTATERLKCDGNKNCKQNGCTVIERDGGANQASTAAASNIVYIAVDKLHPHPDNPRKNIGDVTELAESIKANGILQNLTVVPYFSKVHNREMNGLYTVIIGHRRLEAAKLAGLTELPCIIVEMSEKEQLSTMLTENMQRVDLTVYEQAQGFQMMIDLGDTIDDVAEKSGFSKTTVRKRLEIARLDGKTLKKVSARQVTISDFDDLAKIDDIATRNKVLESMGTANFKNSLQIALKDQNTAKRMQEWIDTVRTFATEDASASWQTRQFVKSYGYWNLTTDIEVPEDADTVSYFYKVGKNQLDIYKDKDIAKEDAEAERREEERRKIEAIKALGNDIDARHYNLRCEFVKSLPNSVFREHMYQTGAFILNSSYEFGMDTSLKLFGYLLGIKVDESDLDDNITITECCPGVCSALEAFPEKTLFCMAYSSVESMYNGYSEFLWSTSRHQHVEDEQLDLIYDTLCKLGYELSDEERQMRDGTHEIFSDGQEK